MSIVSRSALARRIAPLAAVLAIGGASVAAAIPPGGVDEVPGGAVATVTNSPVAVGGVVSFSGTGFTEGEQVNVKIDDGSVLTSGKTDVFTVATAKADGTVSGVVDLSKAAADSPVVAGNHLLRFLSLHNGVRRSLHADFVVGTGASAGTPAAGDAVTPAPGAATPAPAATTPAVQPVRLLDAFLRPTKTKKKLVVKLKGGPFGSAGTLSVKTKNAYKIGKGKPKPRIVAKSTPYFVDKLGTSTVNVTLTPDAQALLKRKKALKVIVTLVDASGEATVRQDAKVVR